MRVKLFCLIFLSFFLIGNVFALTTVIEVKTLPHHRVLITPIATSEGFSALAQPIEGFSGQYGDVRFELTFEESYFDLNFLIKDGDILVFSEKVREDFISGSLVEVEVLPEGVEPLIRPEEKIVEKVIEEIVNETDISSEEEVELNIENQNLKKIIMNGYSIIEENKPMINSIYYSILGFTALLLIFLTVRKNGRKVEKIEKKKGDVEGIEEDEDLNEAEEKLKQAQVKVEELRKKKGEKMQEAKKKLLEAEKEIMKLRGVEVEEKKEMTSEEMKKKIEEGDKKKKSDNKADKNYKDFQKDNKYKRKDWKK